VTNRAAAFLDGVMTSFFKLFGIAEINTTSFSPKSNSRVERLQRTLIECFKATCVEGQPWKTSLSFVAMVLKSLPIKGIGVSPFDLISSGY